MCKRKGNMRKAAQDCSKGACLCSSVFHRNEKRKPNRAAEIVASPVLPEAAANVYPIVGMGICGKRFRTVPRVLVCVPTYSIETRRERQTIPLRYARSSSEHSPRHKRGNMRKAVQDCSEDACLCSSVFHRNEKRKAKTAASTPASESRTMLLR